MIFFVIRVAGNVVAPSQVGSVEFAAERYDCAVVVVLGHSHCGAIQATIDTLMCPDYTTIGKFNVDCEPCSPIQLKP